MGTYDDAYSSGNILNVEKLRKLGGKLKTEIRDHERFPVDNTCLLTLAHEDSTGPVKMRLNATNYHRCVRMYGEDANTWRGREIKLYVDDDVTGPDGQRSGGVRVFVEDDMPW